MTDAGLSVVAPTFRAMAASRYMRRCGKVRYADRLSALLLLAQAGAAAERRSSTRGETRAYPCPTCRGWQLTSRGRPKRPASSSVA